MSPPAIASPVDFISGPRSAASGKRSAGKIASFAHARVGFAVAGSFRSAIFSPSISRQARSMIGMPVALAMNGTVREARGLASITHSSPSFSASWRLNRPRTSRPRVRAVASSRTLASMAAVIDGPGMTQAESPEWTPAGSTCSRMPATQASCPSHRMSTSSSIAFCRNWSTRVTAPVPGIAAASSSSLWQIRMPRPPSTNEGRTSTG